MEEAENIIRILKEAREALATNDSFKLKVLSDQTIHSAAVYQDPDNIIVAVIVYALGKIIERENYRKMEGWEEFYSILLKCINSGIKYLEKEDYEKFMDCMGNIRNSLNKIDSSLAVYIKDVLYKAEVNKAFRLYEHGLSAEKTADLLGISLWDLAGYIGQTTISESHFNEAVPVKERIKLAENFFK